MNEWPLISIYALIYSLLIAELLILPFKITISDTQKPIPVLMLTDLKTLLQKAYHGGYAVGAFNVINLEFTEAIIEASRRTGVPVILNMADVHFKYVTPEYLVPAIKAMINPEGPDVVINLDHGLSKESVIRAIRAGFTSVMFDGSKLPYEENVRQTAEIAKIAHAAGVSVEGELGAVGGAEGGGLKGSADPGLFTNPAQTQDYIHRTGCDALAIAIGNVHGLYRGEPNLDFNRLGEIRALTTIPLVLHGGSGISAADFRRAIDLGIAKINFYTGMSEVALTTVRDQINADHAGYNDFPELMLAVKEAVGRVVEEQILIFANNKF